MKTETLCRRIKAAGKSKASRSVALFICIGTTLALTACSSAESERNTQTGKASANAGLLKSTELSLCGIDNYPPMDFVQNGKLTGFDIDMMQGAAKRMGVELRTVTMGFEGVLPALDAKRCDVAGSGMYINDERIKVAHGIPYMTTTPQLLVAAGNPLNIKTISDLAGKRMAIDSSSANLAIVEKWNEKFKLDGKEEMNIVPFPNTPSALQQITIGRADAFVDSDTVLAYMETQAPSKFEYVRIQQQADSKIGLYVRKGNQELADQLQTQLQDMYKSGELATLAGKWNLDVQNLDQVFRSTSG